MVIPILFQSLDQLRALQQLACNADDEVFLHSPDDAIMVDAKSFVGLFTLDFSKPVNVVTNSPYVIHRLTPHRV